jgi:uncharacterized protein (TIGR00288 family)
VKEGDRSLAVFIDFENLALGFQGRRDRFDINRVLERLVEKGKIVVKKAYADWNRFSHFTQQLHEAAIELIEIPRRAVTGKNSADIRLVVDAMDLAYSKDHINTFVVVSGDSDFSPLVSKLKELGKHVIGLGMQESTSDLLRDNCDEFIYYEDLGREPILDAEIDLDVPETKRKAFAMLMDALQALRRENKDVLWSSMIKDTIKRKKPSFNESYHGYRTFSELLEDAAHQGLLTLETDKRSRTYVVTRFGAELHDAPPVVPPGSSEPGMSPVVVVPSPLGVSVDPNVFASHPQPAPQHSSRLAPMATSVDGQPLPPRKKSRRRRRRGGGGANGQHAAAAVAPVTPGIPTDPSPLVNEPVGVTPETELREDDEEDDVQDDAPAVDLEPVATTAPTPAPVVAPAPQVVPTPTPEPPLTEVEQSFAQGLFEEASAAAVVAPVTPEELASEPVKPTRAKRTTTTRKKTTPSATASTPATPAPAKPKRATTSRKKKSEGSESAG